MADARCEPPEHLRGVDGWHVVWRDGIPNVRAWFAGYDRPWGGSTPEQYDALGYRYGGPAPDQSSAPVPSPEAVARLVEAARRIGEAHDDRDIEPATSEGHKALATLRAALAAFPEERT